MKHWLVMSVGMVLAGLVLAVGADAAMTTLSGEVLTYEAGKAISVRDLSGKVHDLQITKDTKLDADVKVGSNVSIQADGNKAQSVKVASGGPPGGAAPAPGMGGE